MNRRRLARSLPAARRALGQLLGDRSAAGQGVMAWRGNAFFNASGAIRERYPYEERRPPARRRQCAWLSMSRALLGHRYGSVRNGTVRVLRGRKHTPVHTLYLYRVYRCVRACAALARCAQGEIRTDAPRRLGALGPRDAKTQSRRKARYEALAAPSRFGRLHLFQPALQNPALAVGGGELHRPGVALGCFGGRAIAAVQVGSRRVQQVVFFQLAAGG